MAPQTLATEFCLCTGRVAADNGDIRAPAIIATLLAAHLAVGCTQSSVVQCGDVFCPETSTCVSPERGCFPTEQVEACEGAADGASCTVTDIAGTCRDGLCVNESCGDGVLDAATEICDDGNVFDGDSCASNCQTARCLVPISHDTVQELLDDEACPTAHISPGTYGEQLVINRDVNIVRAGEGEVIIDGGGAGRTVTIPTGVRARLADLEITGGTSDECGGGVLNSGDLIVENVRVVANQARHGGGICHDGGTLVSLGLELADNEARATADIAKGAGLFATAILVVSGRTRVTNNTSRGEGRPAHGGGVYIESTTAAFTGDCELRGNQALSAFGGATYGRGAFGGAGYAAGASLTLSGCTIAANSADGEGLDAGGGGFFIHGGTTSLTAGSRFEDNTVSGDIASGGGLFLNGAQTTVGELAITGNQVTGITEARGGGVFAASAPGVPATPFILDGGTVSGNAAIATGVARGGGLMIRNLNAIGLTRLTIDSNRAEGGAPGGGGGGLSVLAGGGGTTAVLLRDTTFSSNSSTAAGGGVHIEASSSVLDVRTSNTTLSANSAASGGAMLLSTAGNNGLLRLYSSTITDNDAVTSGGGLRVVAGTVVGVVVEGVVVAGNTGGVGPDCSATGTFSFATIFSIIGDATGGCGFGGTGDQIGVDPMLGPLADNGGPTLTHLPLAGSPAIESGNPAGCLNPGMLTADQRELPRPVGICDIGSVELQ